MPPKKRRNNNKKKKGGSNGNNGNNDSSQPRPAFAANSNLPQQQRGHSFRPSTVPIPPNSDNCVKAGGLYSVYKYATQRFKDRLAALVPVEIFAQDRVQTMMDAVDYIVENDVSIHPVLFEDCRISLQFRKKYSEKVAEDGDEGHEHFVLVLNYCLQSLKPLVPVVNRKAIKKKAKQFSFVDLQLSDSEDEEDEEESVVPAKAKRPERPVEPTRDYTFQDLIQGTDRLQAIVFLDSVERAMEIISSAYKELKLSMRSLNANIPETASFLTKDVIKAAVTTNFCIRQVQLMEEELKLDHPHLSTFYRIIACIHLVHITNQMNDVVQASGKSVPKTEMTAFVGDVVEASFRTNPQSDSHNHVDKLTSDFCRKWSLPQNEIAELVDATAKLVEIEIRRNKVVEPVSSLESADLATPSWMLQMQFIGGDRSILNTHWLLVQELSKLLMFEVPMKIVLKPGLFGTLWDEQRRPARKIRGDMDQLLMEEILPELFTNCQYGPLTAKMPILVELFPLFQLLGHYTTNLTEPVPLSLSFGVHAILTSIFELQGHNDVATIGKSAKISYNHFFDQLQEQHDSDLPNSTKWMSRLENMILGRDIPACIGDAINKRSEDLAYWNPCCAGMFLTLLTYDINLDIGADMIDSFAQLRIVLHLYNALQQRNLIEGDIPLLSSLDKYFENVQAVWEGDKPTRNNIVKRFWLAYGVSADEIEHVHRECRRYVLNPRAFPNAEITITDETEIQAEHFSESYRRICLGDFSGMLNRYEDFRTNIEDVPAWQLNFVGRMNDTLDLMENEKELLSWNLTAVGGCLNDFIDVLMGRLGLLELQDEVADTLSLSGHRMDGTRINRRSFADSETYKERFALVVVFVDELLGPLEFLESVDWHPMVFAARDCLDEYFETLGPSKYQIYEDLF